MSFFFVMLVPSDSIWIFRSPKLSIYTTSSLKNMKKKGQALRTLGAVVPTTRLRRRTGMLAAGQTEPPPLLEAFPPCSASALSCPQFGRQVLVAPSARSWFPAAPPSALGSLRRPGRGFSVVPFPELTRPPPEVFGADQPSFRFSLVLASLWRWWVPSVVGLVALRSGSTERGAWAWGSTEPYPSSLSRAFDGARRGTPEWAEKGC